MKTLVYHGPRDVQIDDKPRPDIQDPEDIRIADRSVLEVDALHYKLPST
jgi:hypothetical protein